MRVTVSPPVDPTFIIEMNLKEIHLLRLISEWPATLAATIKDADGSAHAYVNDIEVMLCDLHEQLAGVSL